MRANLTTAPTHVLKPDPASLGRSTSLIRGIRGQTSDGNQSHEATDPQADTPEPFSTPLTGPAGTLTIPGPATVINRRSSLHEPSGVRRPPEVECAWARTTLQDAIAQIGYIPAQPSVNVKVEARSLEFGVSVTAVRVWTSRRCERSCAASPGGVTARTSLPHGRRS